MFLRQRGGTNISVESHWKLRSSYWSPAFSHFNLPPSRKRFHLHTNTFTHPSILALTSQSVWTLMDNIGIMLSEYFQFTSVHWIKLSLLFCGRPNAAQRASLCWALRTTIHLSCYRCECNRFFLRIVLLVSFSSFLLWFILLLCFSAIFS